MLTRNQAKVLNIQVENHPLPEKKPKISPQSQCLPERHPRMVSFAEDIYAPTPLYEVDIDFDDAHDAWVANKIKQKNGCYKYRKHPKKQ